MFDSYVKDSLNSLNKFREDPKALAGELTKVITMLDRLSKGNEEYTQSFHDFIKQLPKFPKLPKFKYSEELSQKAQGELEKLIKNPEKYKKFQNGTDLNATVGENLKEDDAALIASSQEIPSLLAANLLLNREDTESFGQQILRNANLVEIGLAHKLVEEGIDRDHYVILLLSKEGALREKLIPTDVDLDELKEAFDLFDIDNSGEVSANDIEQMLMTLGYPKTENGLYSIMQELNEEKGDFVSWPTFANFIIGNITNHQDEDLIRKIFDLYKDDPKKDTISILAMLQVCHDLGEEESLNRLRRLLRTKNGIDIKLSFPEFLAFMREKYGEDAGKKVYQEKFKNIPIPRKTVVESTKRVKINDKPEETLIEKPVRRYSKPLNPNGAKTTYSITKIKK